MEDVCVCGYEYVKEVHAVAWGRGACARAVCERAVGGRVVRERAACERVRCERCVVRKNCV